MSAHLDSDVALRAASLLSDARAVLERRGLVQHRWLHSSGAVCLLGAVAEAHNPGVLERVVKQHGEEFGLPGDPIVLAAEQALDTVALRYAAPGVQNALMWQDDDGVTQQQVLRVIDEAEALLRSTAAAQA